jgi:hypothetical protein
VIGRYALHAAVVVNTPMLARKLLRRWKCILHAERAIQTLQWAWTEGWIE